MPVKCVLFGGGSGVRRIHMALCHMGVHVSRIAPVSDNGGSSKHLRNQFNTIALGDIRQALMTAASGELKAQAHGLVRVFNWRLPRTASVEQLNEEFGLFQTGRHELMQSLALHQRRALCEYLHFFNNEKNGLDLTYGSIGNFILMGAVLKHGDINGAIEGVRRLCAIQGEVWPISLHNELNIEAQLKDGQGVYGQSAITKLNRDKRPQPIKSLKYANADAAPEINSKVIQCLCASQLIAYGPGSFFTSILPHFLLKELAQCIATLAVPKIFIGNMLQDNEVFGYSLAELVHSLVDTATQHNTGGVHPRQIISHVIGHGGAQSSRSDYVPLGEGIARLEAMGIHPIIGDFEDPWRSGHHDAEFIGQLLIKLASESQSGNVLSLGK